MKRIIALLIALTIPVTAQAESVSQCMGLGLPAAWADIVCGAFSAESVTTSAGDVTVTSGDVSILTSGKTIELETGTASSACAGTGTFNGTTAVTISTTCAKTGSLIFLSATGDGSGAAANDQVGCWATNIVNNTSFDADCSDANNNATFVWLILHEAP